MYITLFKTQNLELAHARSQFLAAHNLEKTAKKITYFLLIKKPN